MQIKTRISTTKDKNGMTKPQIFIIVNSVLSSSLGKKTVNNIIITAIMEKAIIKYLNFNGNTPIISIWNDKRKIMLRQCREMEWQIFC